ncbi:TetR/AcrR family transcriptional regulator [Streptomyces sp. NPDC056723]|uniref:TetR/AcrR family transcriptional regulator n=1 Tax=Streptomyces sp. NPDC056723 TaxID=3345925 RepID=UPI0036A4CD9D
MTTPRQKATRPRDRKQQIVAAASEMFRASGYHNVGMADIAEAVGISGPALYRHFRGKQDLLHATLVDAIDTTTEAFRSGYSDLPTMLGAVAAVILEKRHAGVLWERELTHMPPEQRQELRIRYVAGIEPLRAVIAKTRPELPADTVDLLLRAVLASFTAMGPYSGKVATPRTVELMTDVGLALCRAEAPVLRETSGGDRPPVSRGLLLPVSRREAVLAGATRLFAERGYGAVGMEDIATAAAGMAGPSLYHHFAGKSAILVAALTRCLEAMLFDLSAALDLAETHGQALDAALRSFVRLNLEHGDAMSALLSEIVYLSPEERQPVRRMQHDFVAEWTALVTGHRPDLSAAEAELIVHATINVVNGLRHTTGVWMRPAYREELILLGRTVLGLPAQPGQGA